MYRIRPRLVPTCYRGFCFMTVVLNAEVLEVLRQLPTKDTTGKWKNRNRMEREAREWGVFAATEPTVLS